MITSPCNSAHLRKLNQRSTLYPPPTTTATPQTRLLPPRLGARKRADIWERCLFGPSCESYGVASEGCLHQLYSSAILLCCVMPRPLVSCPIAPPGKTALSPSGFSVFRGMRTKATYILMSWDRLEPNTLRMLPLAPPGAAPPMRPAPLTLLRRRALAHLRAFSSGSPGCGRAASLSRAGFR